jgi:uncharacterized iron-regulated protein
MCAATRVGTALAVVALAACASPPLDEQRLATELTEQLAARPLVLLGEVHDNAVQHRIRAAALARLLEQGRRPALAFEQFDRERQAAIDRARAAPPPADRALADHVIEQGRAPGDGWQWSYYRPFVELALRYQLPIVAANLSRADAARVAREGLTAVLAAGELRRLGLDAIDPGLQRAHEDAVNEGHCRLLPATALPGLARAQIARDAVLAAALRGHADRGVVLLTGNGHARRDIGVPRHLSDEQRQRTWSIGLLEDGTSERAGAFDVAFHTVAQPRPDPCEQLKPGRLRRG